MRGSCCQHKSYGGDLATLESITWTHRWHEPKIRVRKKRVNPLIKKPARHHYKLFYEQKVQ